ncbi:hypothetical protein [Nocardioides panacisoli]|uniref:Peptidase S8/S53 domain-containing protein n=1 Tax=Nocardioides panacisoli TaxID=627624 RepID=A0ABP7IJX5_9ACTN
MRLSVLPAAALLAACVTAPGAAHADATPAQCTETGPTSPRTAPVTGSNSVYDALRIGATADLFEGTARAPGQGVTVVVVGPRVAAPGVEAVDLGLRSADGSSPYGAIAAGVVRGPDEGGVPIGFAPGARVVAAEVYDTDYGLGIEGAAEPDADRVAAGLEWVHAQRGQLGDRVVALVPQAVGKDDRLTAAVKRLASDGVLVVAGIGDRPETSDTSSPLSAFAGAEGTDLPPGEDARGATWPAGYGSVLAVGVPPLPGDTDVSDYVVPNSDVDVSAPTVGGVSWGGNGISCRIDVASSQVAAAEVAAVAALVWSAPGHEQDTARELRDRLVRTAAGSDAPGALSPVSGAGIVQPLDAVQRIDVGRAEPGDVVERATPAPAPEPRTDDLAGTRRDALWWGLVAGGALVVAVLLRPVLNRRRGS